MGAERPLISWRNTSLRHTFGLLDPPISCLVSFIGTDKIYRLLSTCNKAATATATGDQDWKLAGKSGQLALCFQLQSSLLLFAPLPILSWLLLLSILSRETGPVMPSVTISCKPSLVHGKNGQFHFSSPGSEGSQSSLEL